jgi:hypothetical protein
MAQPNWNTPVGSIGTYPSLIEMIPFQLSASAVLPAVSITYQIISGSLPDGVTMTADGYISGLPSLVTANTNYSFVVRATDNLQNIRDRTFSITISGVAAPEFTTPAGTIIEQWDSIWIEYPIQYSNPANADVLVRLIQGNLPPGLEINEFGLIRGYAAPPTLGITLPTVTTYVTSTATTTNALTGFSTAGFTSGRPLLFSGTVFGGVSTDVTYYVKDIIDDVSFTVSLSANGPEYPLSSGIGYMTVTLPNVNIGQPTIRTYSFTLKLESDVGDDTESYSITVINQNASNSIGGPGFGPNTRVPTIYNTRPPTYDIQDDPVNYSYYILPPDGRGTTYPATTFAYLGKIESNNYFSFKVLGHDFDSNDITYLFADLPLGLVGDAVTGWITGNPVIADNTISSFSFRVSVYKTSNPSLTTPFVGFSFKLATGIDGEIIWISNNDLGTIFNGTVSNANVEAISDVDLQYRLVSGMLPPNLTLLSNGEISGVVAYQPNETFTAPNVSTPFTFTIEAYSPQFAVVSSQQTFTMTVFQEYNQPTDTLYIKCSPSIADRTLLSSLLNNEQLIPSDFLYRAEDPYFGKASSVVYEHAFGIYASSFDEYVAAVTKNHYWRNITLGEIETAIARDTDTGEILYEVVYSRVIDNLVNPQGVSVDKEVVWPRRIPLSLGPWYTSITDIYTSYIGIDSPPPTYYTSLTPGEARVLYPNSLPNMREQVGDVLGQEFNSNLLPKWMTSQQLNGSTTGFVPAWVIAYCSPGTTTLNGQTVSYGEYIKYQIENNWTDPVGYVNTLNQINFRIDRFTVDKSVTYNYDKNVSPPAWTGLPSASPVPDPLDSQDFYVLFPRKTILPDQTQY